MLCVRDKACPSPGKTPITESGYTNIKESNSFNYNGSYRIAIERISMTEYHMRYADRALSETNAWDIFETAEYCVASTVDADGMPYGVPISFVVMNNQLYFHTTNTYGHKLDNFQHDARICVTAVVDVEACFEDDFMTSRYGSAMAFGRIRRVENSVEVRHALVALCMKYLPNYKHEIGNAISKDLAETAVWAVEVETITGKAARRR